MAVAYAMTFIGEVEMRVDLNEMNVAVTLKCVDARNVYGMIAAEHHRQRAAFQNLSHAGLNIGVAPHRFRMDDVGITEIRELPSIRREIEDVLFIIVGSAPDQREQCRRLADRLWSEPGAGTPLRS